MTGCTSGGYDQLETSPEAIEQELRPAVCERRQTYDSIDEQIQKLSFPFIIFFQLKLFPWHMVRPVSDKKSCMV